jgi:hypothetical protein
MKIITQCPRSVRDIENVFIPLEDGGRLAARIWLPEDAESSPVPAILEYIPYRKGDRMRDRDEPMHRYFAGHGYAAVRASAGAAIPQSPPDSICRRDRPRPRGDPVARRSTLLHGRSRHDGKVLGRVQLSLVPASGRSRISAPCDRCSSDNISTMPTSWGPLLAENFFWARAHGARHHASRSERSRALARDVAGAPRPSRLSPTSGSVTSAATTTGSRVGFSRLSRHPAVFARRLGDA